MTGHEPSPGKWDGAMPFADLVGIKIALASAESVVARLAWGPERCTIGGILHGGAIMSLADTAGGLAAYLNLPEGAVGTTTLASATQFTRGLRAGSATATSRPLHKGRTTVVIETDVRDDDNRLLARVTQTQTALTP